MPSPGMRGWYVEIDEELIRIFEVLFPDIGAKTLVTSVAIIEAIKSRSFQPLEGDYVSRNERGTEGPNTGTEGPHSNGTRPRE